MLLGNQQKVGGSDWIEENPRNPLEITNSEQNEIPSLSSNI